MVDICSLYPFNLKFIQVSGIQSNFLIRRFFFDQHFYMFFHLIKFAKFTCAAITQMPPQLSIVKI